MKLNHKLGVFGFTLIELLVAISIIVVLASIGAVSYSKANQSSRNSRRQADIEQVRAALEIYRADNPGYPDDPTTGDLSAINGISGYLAGSSSIVDPLDASPYVYSYSVSGCTTDCTDYVITYYLEPDPGTLRTVTNP